MIKYDSESANETPSGTMTVSRPATCKSPECEKFDVPVPSDLEISFVGDSGYIYYTCPTCGVDSGLSFDLTDQDFVLAKKS